MQSTKAGDINGAVVMYGGRATYGKEPRKSPIKVKVIRLSRGLIRLDNAETGRPVQQMRSGSPVFWEPVPVALLPFTVDLAGSERHDGENGYTYVVHAPSADVATKAVMQWHGAEHEDDDLIHERTWQGIPSAPNEPPTAWNDMRENPAMRELIATAAAPVTAARKATS